MERNGIRFLVEGSSRAWLKVELLGCESKVVLSCGVRVLEVGYGLELGACTAAFWCCCSLACVLLEARALAAFCNSELLWLEALDCFHMYFPAAIISFFLIVH
ncbi:unnamed protein product [Lathyrus oleraceus]